MPDELATNHITPAELIDYFDKDLTEEEEDRIELHLAGCAECTARARQSFALSRLCEQWSAATHGEARLRELIRSALESAAIEEPADRTLQARLRRWRASSRGLAEGAVRVTVKAVKDASQIATDGMDGLLRPGAWWRFTPQPALVAVRGGEGNKKAPPKIARAETGDQIARVKVDDEDERAREVVVSVDRFPREREAPIVMLASMGEGGEDKPRFIQMQRHGLGLLAKFRDLPPGEYLVAFEPFPDRGIF